MQKMTMFAAVCFAASFLAACAPESDMPASNFLPEPQILKSFATQDYASVQMADVSLIENSQP
ncbi:MAG: hypothetical protein ABWY00_05740 [Dongiaceae bacterium]